MNAISNREIFIRLVHLSFFFLVFAHFSFAITSTISPGHYITIYGKDKLVLVSTAILGIVFLISSKNASRYEYNKLFLLLTGLCVLKALSLIIFTLLSFNHDLTAPFNPADYFGNRYELIAEFTDMYLFSFLMFMIGLSFTMKKPYFIATATAMMYKIFGTVLILISLLGIAGMSMLLWDQYMTSQCEKLALEERAKCLHDKTFMGRALLDEKT